MELTELTNKFTQLLQIDNINEAPQKIIQVLFSIFLSILQMWKQHIMYLDNEENRLLIEMRDALLPELMSGKLNLFD